MVFESDSRILFFFEGSNGILPPYKTLTGVFFFFFAFGVKMSLLLLRPLLVTCDDFGAADIIVVSPNAASEEPAASE